MTTNKKEIVFTKFLLFYPLTLCSPTCDIKPTPLVGSNVFDHLVLNYRYVRYSNTSKIGSSIFFLVVHPVVVMVALSDKYPCGCTAVAAILSLLATAIMFTVKIMEVEAETTHCLKALLSLCKATFLFFLFFFMSTLKCAVRPQ